MVSAEVSSESPDIGMHYYYPVCRLWRRAFAMDMVCYRATSVILNPNLQPKNLDTRPATRPIKAARKSRAASAHLD